MVVADAATSGAMSVIDAPTSDLLALPCVWMRGGTSKAAFFDAGVLPSAGVARDRLLLAAMGTPDARQIDGIGGGTPLTTKIAIISASRDGEADVDYLFGQVVIGGNRIDYAPTCGNILAGVGPYAIERGLVRASDPETIVRIRMVNTAALCEAAVTTPGGRVRYAGDVRISGVPTSGAPIELRFRDIAGSSCGALYPTGRRLDTVAGVEVTCIDNGMPVVVMRAADLGISGYEEPMALDANAELKARIEAVRLVAGPLMRLGDVADKVVPKMTLVAPARDGGDLATRSFIPKKCHDAIGVLGAASVATAHADDGTVCAGLPGRAARAGARDISVEHPTGEFTIRLGPPGEDAAPTVALLRTARPLFRGTVLVPSSAVEGG
jgi:4-oxalomesaconate tautomerase